MTLIKMKEHILSHLSAECPWRDTLYWYDTISSTNTKAKELAQDGAPHGTVLVADHQTGGRGRLGRSFSSPAGMGVYLSVLLRPNCQPAALMHLTCAAAVAMCNAVEQAAGIRPKIKWTNDLVFNKKKLGGILTELSPNPDTGLVDYAIIGIGINCCQNPSDFPPEIGDMAASLSMVSGKEISRAYLAAAMIESWWKWTGPCFRKKKKLWTATRKTASPWGRIFCLCVERKSATAQLLIWMPKAG